LDAVAKELGGTIAGLALAWTIRNTDVSTAMIGASTVKQLSENLKALELLPKLTKEVEEKIEQILGNKPRRELNWANMQPAPGRR